MIDFTNPEVQQIIIQQVVDIADTGKYDGVFFDYWQDKRDVLNGYRTIPQQQQARLAILRGIRDRVHPDFLILGNVNANTMPLSAPYINGAMMETYQSAPVDGRRTELFLLRLESTLSWSEHNLRTPQINCLWLGLQGKDYTNPQVQQWLRLITTMSLTMSDGYVSFYNGQYSGHRYEWHAFWDVEIGQPVTGKELIYNGTNGFYTRDFTKGFVAYNRSNKAQPLTFDERVTSIATGETAAFHSVSAMDGDIFVCGSEYTIAVDPRDLLTTLRGELKRK